MIDSIREFVIDSIRDMNYSVEDIGDDTELGPGGADLESVALAELCARVEIKYGLEFTDDEAEELSVLAVGEFCACVADRLTAKAPGE
jgi:acyl carrier protein